MSCPPSHSDMHRPSPDDDNDSDLYFTPPTSPFTDSPPYPAAPAAVSDALVPDPDTDDVFPEASDLAVDLALDGESLSILEKIYLYSRSRAYYHRIFIVHKLSEYLDHVTPQEAVEYVLPLLSGLAMDEGLSFTSRDTGSNMTFLLDESVREALAEELVPVIWWFFSVSLSLSLFSRLILTNYIHSIVKSYPKT